MSATPLILADNLFDDVVLHPDHVVTAAGGEVAGGEVFRLADNLRDATAFVGATPDSFAGPIVACPPARWGVASCVVLDRGHNLTGRRVAVLSAETGHFAGAYATHVDAVVPAVPGGLPSDPNGCLTPDGVWWKTFPAGAAPTWCFGVHPMGPGFAPRIPGLYLGEAYRLPEYLDGPNACAERVNVKVLQNALSHAGVRVKRHVRAFAELDLRVRLEEADYDALAPHVARLLRLNHPWWVCVDDGTPAGAAALRLYQLPGDTVFDPVLTPATRDVQLLLEEVAPAVVL